MYQIFIPMYIQHTFTNRALFSALNLTLMDSGRVTHQVPKAWCALIDTRCILARFLIKNPHQCSHFHVGTLILELPSFPTMPANLPELCCSPVGCCCSHLCRERGEIVATLRWKEEMVWKTRRNLGSGNWFQGSCFHPGLLLVELPLPLMPDSGTVDPVCHLEWWSAPAALGWWHHQHCAPLQAATFDR